MTDVPASLEKVFQAPDLLLRTEHSLCPGCGEPVALRTMPELIRDLGLRERTICVAGIGCYTAFPQLMDVDVMPALQALVPSDGTARKRVPPESFPVTMPHDSAMAFGGL